MNPTPASSYSLSDAEYKDFQKYLRFREELPREEHLGLKYAEEIGSYISSHKGRFLRDEHGGYHILMGNQRIPLFDSPDNHALAHMILKACNVTMVTNGARIAIKRVIDIAYQDASRLIFKQFSAMSNDRQQVYIPVSSGELLRVDASGCQLVANGDNEAELWLEHPLGDPLHWEPFKPDVVQKILTDNLERLLVDTQACKIPEMRWFVAMHEGLFPFVRDAHPARLIAAHQGGSQSGKTSGSQRFVKLHGLGTVKGDYSPAALRNMLDIGLLVLDNKEQVNFTRELIDYCLFLATGAEHGRSNQDGTIRTHGSGRPVGVITTIEGVPKTELQKRCVSIEYFVPMGAERLRREPIEAEISKLRHEMLSALVPVLETYFRLRPKYISTPNPIPEFEEHFTTLCYLLRAYEQVAGRTEDWAEKIISVWAKTLDANRVTKDIGELEETILWILSHCECAVERHNNFEHKSVRGRLYITEASPLLNALHKLAPKLGPPSTPQGLTARLRGSQLTGCVFLDEESSPSPLLKRKSGKRPIGFFVRNDDDDAQ